MPEKSNSPTAIVSGSGMASRKNIFLQSGQVPPEAGGVSDNLSGVFLKGDENTGLVEEKRPIRQSLQPEHGFSRTRSPSYQGGFAPRHTAPGNLVKTLNTGQSL